MTLHLRLAVVIATAILSSGCASEQIVHRGEADSLPPEFAQVLRNYETAWRNKDADALANLFANNGYVLPNGAPPVHGRDNIRKHYEGAGGPLYLSVLAWCQNGGVGYIIGEYSHEPPPTQPAGKFTLTLSGFKQHPDSAGYVDWFIMSDMDNGNTRPAKPASP